MATNEQLTEAAHDLAHKLEITVETENLSNKDLKALVKNLNEQHTAKVAADAEAEKVGVLLARVGALSEELGAEPGPEVDTLDSAGLAALVESLEAGVVEKKKADADAQGMRDAEKLRADAEAGAKRKEEAKETPPVYDYYIMPGHSLIVKRGILTPGEEVSAQDIAGPDGAQTLEALVVKGTVGKGE